MSNGQRVGYVRVSAADQETARQLDGVALDRVFTDRASGRNTERPALRDCLAYVRAGDTLTVHSMDRLARSLVDLERLVDELTARGVVVEFIKERLTFRGTDEPFAVLMRQVIGAVSQFERAMIRERQREGIALAKSRGVYTGRKPALNAAQACELRQRHLAGERVAALARAYGVSRDTVYGYLKLPIQDQNNRCGAGG